MSGVTLAGFEKKTLEEIKTEIRDDILAINPGLDLTDTSAFGQIIGVFADKLREAWDVAEAVYRAFYPDSASGEALDQVCSLSGITREAETRSTVTLDQMFLNDGVTVPAGSVVSIGENGARWETLTALTNSTGAAATLSVDAASQDYGEIVGNTGTIDTIQTPIAGWSAAAAISGTLTEPFFIDSFSSLIACDSYTTSTYQTVTFLGGDPWSATQVASEINSQTTGINAYDDGLGRVRIASTTEGKGSFIQVTGTASASMGIPTTLIKGFNTQDAELGNYRETDPELRIRRAQALRSPGAATVEAIYAGLLTVVDVEQVLVFENTFPHVYDSLPPKSFEAMVSGGNDADIAEMIWTKKPAGIESYGSTTVSITDSMGFDHDIYFSRPVERAIEVHYTLTKDPLLYPTDGDNQVKAAVLALVASLEIGDDVIALQFRATPLDIAGVIDVSGFTIGFLGGTLGTSNLSIDKRSKVTLDSGDITVA